MSSQPSLDHLISLRLTTAEVDSLRRVTEQLRSRHPDSRVTRSSTVRQALLAGLPVLLETDADQFRNLSDDPVAFLSNNQTTSTHEG